eukprot:363403-Chlamydomonas_euryale.AAC.4
MSKLRGCPLGFRARTATARRPRRCHTACSAPEENRRHRLGRWLVEVRTGARNGAYKPGAQPKSRLVHHRAALATTPLPGPRGRVALQCQESWRVVQYRAVAASPLGVVTQAHTGDGSLCPDHGVVPVVNVAPELELRNPPLRAKTTPRAAPPPTADGHAAATLLTSWPRERRGARAARGGAMALGGRAAPRRLRLPRLLQLLRLPPPPSLPLVLVLLPLLVLLLAAASASGSAIPMDGRLQCMTEMVSRIETRCAGACVLCERGLPPVSIHPVPHDRFSEWGPVADLGHATGHAAARRALRTDPNPCRNTPQLHIFQ